MDLINTKLVRDLIPKIATESDSDNIFKKYLSDEEYHEGLINKIIEETEEIIEQLNKDDGNNCKTEIIEEMADLLEVLDACNELLGIDNILDIMHIIDDNYIYLAKYGMMINIDYISLFNTSSIALYHSFKYSNSITFEREVCNLCSIILGYLYSYNLNIYHLNDIKVAKKLARGGFMKKYYLELK